MHPEDVRLTELAEYVMGNRYSPIDASFTAVKEFKVSWSKKGKELNLQISDYLRDAPDHVLTSLLSTIVDMVAHRPFDYGKEYLDWVTSDDFSIRNRPSYLQRSKNLTRTSIGRTYDLAESADRLLEYRLLTENDVQNSFFSWTSRPNIRKMGYCSPMMRVVAVSSILDDPSVPEYVVDYVVYHESLHLRQGYRPNKRAHDSDFRREERSFPSYKEAEAYLNSLSRGRSAGR